MTNTWLHRSAFPMGKTTPKTHIAWRLTSRHIGEELRHPHVIDNAETGWVDCTGVLNQTASLFAWSLYVEDRQIPVAHVCIHFRQMTPRISKSLVQLYPFSREKRYHLISEGQMLLDHNPQECSGGKPSPIGQCVDRVIHVEKHLGYHADVDDCFKESEDRSERATALNDRCRANSIQTHIGDARNDNHYKSDGYRGGHVRMTPSI